jgi:hypothetical protein
MLGRIGVFESSRVVIVSCGAATIQVSGGWLSSVLGTRVFRHPAPMKLKKRQRTTPTRKRIRAPQHAQSF